MLNLAEYRKKPTLLSDYLPWGFLLAPGIVLNKDGSFQRTISYRGPDLESSTPEELVSISARVNNVLRRFGSNWALFFEADREPAPDYPISSWSDPVAWLVDEERRAQFEEKSARFESRYYLTFVFLPPSDEIGKTEKFLLDAPPDQKEPSYADYLREFTNITDRAIDLMGSVMPQVRALDDSETLTYLHQTISTKRHPISAEGTPAYLDCLIADEAFTGGLDPMLGNNHLRVLTILGFPNMTEPGILDELNRLGFSYRWVTRYIALDKTEATRLLSRRRRQWFAKRKSIAAIVKETLFNQDSVLVDSDADNKTTDADEALQELGADDVAFGYVTATIVVMDADRTIVEEKLRAVEQIVNGRGFATIRETINAVEAWLGSLPGQCYANVRQPIIQTLNLTHLTPLSAIWAGPKVNAHLSGPPLLHAVTHGTTPFRLNIHQGDVGHTLIVGPTGAGKSVLLSLMVLQFRRYQASQVYFFDKGASSRAAIASLKGQFHDLGSEGQIAFQPLRKIDNELTRTFAQDWLCGLIEHEGVKVDPALKELLWQALGNLAEAPVSERTLTGLSLIVQSKALKQVLQPYTLDGPHGRLLDADEDQLALTDVQCFEMEELMHQPAVVSPVLTYLFHRLEERFDGRPTLLVIDEAWVFLDHPIFSARLREWLKVLRKKNVAVVFATQSLADIETSTIAPAIIESCPTRIFLPNDRALEQQTKEIYARFGLNQRQTEIIAQATPKREYYYQSREGNRLFDLQIGPVAQAFCAASSPEDQVRLKRLLDEASNEPFAIRYLKERDLDWAANLLARFEQKKEVIHVS